MQIVYSRVPNLPNAHPHGLDTHRSKTWSLGGLHWDFGQLYAGWVATDMVVLSWNTRYVSLVPALLLARLRGVRVALWGHGYSKRESKWRRRLRLFVGGLADEVIVYDDATAVSLRETLCRPVQCAPNALDQTPIDTARERWLSRPNDLEAFRLHNGLNGPSLLFVSRLETENRLDLLLRAASKLKEVFPRLRVVIIGDGPARSELVELSHRLGLDSSVSWIGACYDEMKLAPWFLTSDLLVYPANAGLSILHAFGYGLPVVTSDRLEAQAPEVRAIEHLHNGVLYRHGDLDDLTRQLTGFLENRDQLDRMSRAARKTVAGRYSMSHMVSGFVEAIEKLRSSRQ